jgi:hypothetical protein
MRIIATLALTTLCAGCVTTESVQFRARPQQEALTRDGQAALVSRGKSSLVLIRPATRQFAAGGRPIFVVGINNMSRGPLEFRTSEIEVNQILNNQEFAMKVITYEELVTEERNRQIAGAILVGLAAGANTYAASRSGYYNSRSTVFTPRGTYQVRTTGYSPTANAIAQANASAQNEAMIASTIERGQQNMAALEEGVIKDNTLLPGEWYGGQLHLQPPATTDSGMKTYSIVMMVGTDRHQVDIVQAGNR